MLSLAAVIVQGDVVVMSVANSELAADRIKLGEDVAAGAALGISSRHIGEIRRWG
jgi:hypothetical protein